MSHLFNRFLLILPCRIDVGSGEDKAYTSLTLSELQRVGTLGMGGFGRVELVCNLNTGIASFSSEKFL